MCNRRFRPLALRISLVFASLHDLAFICNTLAAIQQDPAAAIGRELTEDA
jgi:hypothetical protein